MLGIIRTAGLSIDVTAPVRIERVSGRSVFNASIGQGCAWMCPLSLPVAATKRSSPAQLESTNPPTRAAATSEPTVPGSRIITLGHVVIVLLVIGRWDQTVSGVHSATLIVLAAIRRMKRC